MCIQPSKETPAMRRAIIAAAAIATLLGLTTLTHTFAGAKELSSAGTETGMATCYARHLAGHRTYSGKRYNPHALTAAHATIPIGTHVKVTNLKNDKSVVVLVNDRMSARTGGGIIMDVSRRACTKLKFGRGGEGRVKLEVLNSKVAAKSP
jgi:rare lipoprotein A